MEVFVKNILLIALGAALCVSCSSKRAALVDSAITEAKTLQALAKAQGLQVPNSTDSLIVAAEKQNNERQTEAAYILADEAILQLQLSLLKKEHAAIVAESKIAIESLESSTISLEIYRNALKERKDTPKEQVLIK
jgi:hypothetical protein